jgi:hypothetical protein
LINPTISVTSQLSPNALGENKNMKNIPPEKNQFIQGFILFMISFICQLKSNSNEKNEFKIVIENQKVFWRTIVWNYDFVMYEILSVFL